MPGKTTKGGRSKRQGNAAKKVKHKRCWENTQRKKERNRKKQEEKERLKQEKKEEQKPRDGVKVGTLV